MGSKSSQQRYEDAEIQELSDKELEKYITDWFPGRDKELATQEFNRRQLVKIGKTSLVGWITLGFVVAAFIIAILTFLFTFFKNKP